MATDTVERHRMFKVRKQFADERQNHRCVQFTCWNRTAA
jgi:hypothetical protein